MTRKDKELLDHIIITVMIMLPNFPEKEGLVHQLFAEEKGWGLNGL